MVFRSGKSLSSGYGSLSDSAKTSWEKVVLALTAMLRTPRASKRLWSAFLAERFAAQVGAKSAP
jgi:hypothetical protein